MKKLVRRTPWLKTKAREVKETILAGLRIRSVSVRDFTGTFAFRRKGSQIEPVHLKSRGRRAKTRPPQSSLKNLKPRKPKH